MSVFKDEIETKRVIFNVQIDLAFRLETAKKNARKIGKKLDVDTSVNKALEKFLKKAEKKIEEVQKKKGIIPSLPDENESSSPDDPESDTAGLENEINQNKENTHEK